MPLVSRGQMTVEKSPNYFISNKTPQRIYEMNKNIKLILAVREPVERAISDFVQRYALFFKKLQFIIALNLGTNKLIGIIIIKYIIKIKFYFECNN